MNILFQNFSYFVMKKYALVKNQRVTLLMVYVIVIQITYNIIMFESNSNFLSP